MRPTSLSLSDDYWALLRVGSDTELLECQCAHTIERTKTMKKPIPTETVFAQPKNTMPRIESLYAFLSVDENDGNEGLVGAPIPPMACMPLIAADDKRLSVLRPIAQEVANLTKTKIRLVRFTKREEIGFIEPQ